MFEVKKLRDELTPAISLDVKIYGLFARGYTQQQTADMLKINRRTVHRRLKQLKLKYPDLFNQPSGKPKIISYNDELHSSYTKEKF